MDISLAKAHPQADDDEGGNNAAGHVSFAARGRDTAKDGHGDGVHLKALSRRRVGPIGGSHQEDGAKAGHGAHHGIDDKADLLHMNARIVGS